MSTPGVPAQPNSHILVVDDDPSIHKLVTAFVRPLGVDVRCAFSGAEGLALMRAAPPDLVILDYDMPGQNGLEVLRSMRSFPQLSEVQVIFATGNVKETIITECYEAGANDYVRKPLCRAELTARVRSSLERHSMLEKLQAAAWIDQLTGLPNRALFLDRLEQALKQSKRNGSRFAVLFFDFDRFKVVNDSLGHEIGDILLCNIGDIFRANLRDSDTVARIGGDEFVLLLTNLSEWSDARMKSERFLEAFAKPHVLGGHRVVSTASIGLVTNQFSYNSASEMIRDADAAMYQAKDAGKGRVVVFDQAMHEQAIDRLTLEEDLREACSIIRTSIQCDVDFSTLDDELYIALGGDQFRLVYQPIVSLETGELSGLEALLRWIHPERGTINPVEFIPIAEETGLIVDIGRWVLHTAAQQLADWNHRLRLDHRLSVSVNLSKRELLSASILADVLECHRQYSLQPGDLKLEVTESAIVEKQSDVIPVLRELREHGFPIAMDDFGTGLSSLGALHDYPIDILKIDQSFISALDSDRSLLAVVASITTLADNLGFTTVAEGIETEEVVGALQSVGCTWGQGYYFARPLSASDTEAYLLGLHRKGPCAA